MWDSLSISKDNRKGWQHIGNMISIPHALLLMGNTLRIVYDDLALPDVGTMFCELLQKSMQQHQIRQFSGKHATMFVDQRSFAMHCNWEVLMQHFDHLVDALEAGYLPQEIAWSRDRGVFNFDEDENENLDMSVVPLSEISQGVHSTQDISQTQLFVPMIKAKILTSGAMGTCWIQADMTNEQLQCLYGKSAAITTIDPDEDGCQMLVQLDPKSSHDEVEGNNVPVVFISDNRIKIITCESDVPIKLRLDKLGCEHDLFDQFGCLDQHLKPFRGQLILEKMIKSTYRGNVLFLLAAIQQTQTSIVWEAQQFSMHIDIVGNQTAVGVVLDFWKSILDDEVCNVIGVQTCTHQNEENGKIVVSMNQQSMPMPPMHLRTFLAVNATRAILQQLEAGEGHVLRIKWGGQEIWKGKLHPKLNVQIILGLLDYSFLPSLEGTQVRLVGMAKTFYNVDIDEVSQIFKHRIILLHVVAALHGGGGKENQKVYVRNSLASTLLEQGFDIKMVSAIVDTIMQKAGIKPAAQIAQLPAGKQRMDRLMQLCRDSDVELPPKTVVGASNVAQVGHLNKTKRKVTIQPNPADYVIQDGFLGNEDGTPVRQIDDIVAKSTGIVLTSFEKAKPWLREAQIISPDELAVAVIGNEIGPTSLKSVPLNIPCLNKGNKAVILSCQLFQLGEKKIAPIQNVTQPVLQEPCEIVAMTMWKQDWEQKDWEAIVDQTTVFLRQIWKKSSIDDSAILSVWGKSMRNNKNPTSALHATSVQVHCTVVKKLLAKVLAASGFNGVYTVPKDDKGRINQEYRVVWCDGDITHLKIMSSKVNKCQGLVKVKDTLGLRFHTSDFKDAWSILCPAKPLPVDVSINHIFRIEPLPFGCTGEMLVQWLKVMGWMFRPIKASGPRSWIVGASEVPKEHFLVFNGQPVIAKLLPPKQQMSASPILAGPQPSRTAMKPVDGIFENDPWASYSGTRTANMAANSNRDLAGPTEQKFQQQEQRMQKLEDVVQQLQNETKKGFEEVQKREQAFQSTLKKDIMGLRKEIDQSVQGALTQQSQKLDATLSEIKSLFAAGTVKRGRETTTDDDMDGRI